MTHQNTTIDTTFIIFFFPAISPRHIFDKGVRKAMVQQIYRLRKLREEIKLKAMQQFPDRHPLFTWTCLITKCFFMYWGCWLKISTALNPKKKWQRLTFLPDKPIGAAPRRQQTVVKYLGIVIGFIR
jgi:hypothetical protein